MQFFIIKHFHFFKLKNVWRWAWLLLVRYFTSFQPFARVQNPKSKLQCKVYNSQVKAIEMGYTRIYTYIFYAWGIIKIFSNRMAREIFPLFCTYWALSLSLLLFQIVINFQFPIALNLRITDIVNTNFHFGGNHHQPFSDIWICRWNALTAEGLVWWFTRYL